MLILRGESSCGFSVNGAICVGVSGLKHRVVSMSRHFGRIISWALFLLFLGNSTGYCAEELIAPTRSLESARGLPGKLNVTSEPPGLEVFLDGSWIGRTPVWRHDVKSGVHKLQVGDFQAAINVEKGEMKALSLFQDSLIELPKKSEALSPELADHQTRPEGRKGFEPPGEDKRGDLTPWERFLNRTSPSF
jgi:hypothetical protein